MTFEIEKPWFPRGQRRFGSIRAAALAGLAMGLSGTSAAGVVIDTGGRVMTPGFIDVHYHLSLCNVPVMDMAGSNAPDLDYIGIKAGIAAEEALMRGFTSLRDVGGASWGAKLAADRGEIAGPRVWPSLRAISQFGGHGDANPRFMNPREFGGPENNLERLGYSRIVNGRAEVLTAVREQLKRGTSQIKMHLAGRAGPSSTRSTAASSPPTRSAPWSRWPRGSAPMSPRMSTPSTASGRRSRTG